MATDTDMDTDTGTGTGTGAGTGMDTDVDCDFNDNYKPEMHKISEIRELFNVTVLGTSQLQVPVDADSNLSDGIPQNFESLLQTCLVTVVVFGLVFNVTQFLSVSRLLRTKRISRVGGQYLRLQALFDGAVCLVIIPVSFNDASMPLPSTAFPKLTVALAYFICHIWYSQYLFWQFQVYSVLNLTLLSIDRFVVIRFSMQHNRFSRRQRPAAIGLFFFGFVLAAISSFYCTVEVAHQPDNTTSTNSDTTPHSNSDTSTSTGVGPMVDEYQCKMGSQLFSDTFTMWYSLTWFMTGYAVPALIMVVCYSVMITSLVREKNSFQHDSGCAHSLTIRNTKMKNATRQLIKTVILMGISFIVCLCLDSVATLLTALGLYPYVFNTPLQKLGMMLIAVNCATGPGVTFLLIPALRRTSILLIRRTFCMCPTKAEETSVTGYTS